MAKGAHKYIPIRHKLIYYVMTVVLFIAAVVLPLEFRRPLIELEQLIDNGKNLIAGFRASFSEDELGRLNRFLLRTQAESLALNEELDPYLYLAFNMLAQRGALPPEEEARQRLEEDDHLPEGFDYAKLQQAEAYWRGKFEEDPGVDEIFSRYKRVLVGAKSLAKEAGFRIADAYIMLDTGQREGIYENGIAFLLDGYSWWEEPSFPGEVFEITDNQFWRKSALERRSEFGNNPLHDPDQWLLPRFDVDEWGTWFGVWKTEELSGGFNIFTLDIEASRVRQAMITVLVWTLVVGTLVIALVALIATVLGNMVTRPLTELAKGAQEVAKGNYDHVVPVFRADELGDLTHSFNEMTRGQKEKLNLKAALEKLLSKELAELAGQQGMVLGGQKTDCTLVFTDFAGFSTISQWMTPNEAVTQLNTYFRVLIPIIKKYRGFPDKYIGDAIVAIFGAPIHFRDHAEEGLRCAIELQRALRRLNIERRRHKLPVFEMRIGINSGDVIVGAIGCDMKLEYTSIGETTNLANRMESACEIGHILIAEGTYRRINMQNFQDVSIDTVPSLIQVKGYLEPVKAYRVLVDKLHIEKEVGKGANNYYGYHSRDLETTQTGA
jgi:class 3 adenylate cyclase